jgi:hypothetical protein
VRTMPSSIWPGKLHHQSCPNINRPVMIFRVPVDPKVREISAQSGGAHAGTAIPVVRGWC